MTDARRLLAAVAAVAMAGCARSPAEHTAAPALPVTWTVELDRGALAGLAWDRADALASTWPRTLHGILTVIVGTAMYAAAGLAPPHTAPLVDGDDITAIVDLLVTVPPPPHNQHRAWAAWMLAPPRLALVLTPDDGAPLRAPLTWGTQSGIWRVGAGTHRPARTACPCISPRRWAAMRCRSGAGRSPRPPPSASPACAAGAASRFRRQPVPPRDRARAAANSRRKRHW
jgi:hypothetical protein